MGERAARAELRETMLQILAFTFRAKERTTHCRDKSPSAEGRQDMIAVSKLNADIGYCVKNAVGMVL